MAGPEVWPSGVLGKIFKSARGVRQEVHVGFPFVNSHCFVLYVSVTVKVMKLSDCEITVSVEGGLELSSRSKHESTIFTPTVGLCTITVSSTHAAAIYKGTVFFPAAGV